MVDAAYGACPRRLLQGRRILTCAPPGRRRHYLSPLLFPPLPPPFFPAVNTVPLKTPMAKKPKYMMAAGSLSAFRRIGGILSSTTCWLFIPIMTSNNNIAITNTVLSSSFVFINPSGAKLGNQDPERKKNPPSFCNCNSPGSWDLGAFSDNATA